MANGLSQAWEQKVIEAIFKRTNITAPTTLYVSLHSADPGDTGASELSGNGYARAQLDPDTNNSTNTNWNAIDQAAVASKMTNKLAVTFPTASGNWNSGSAILFFAIWDASSAGNCILSGSITPSGVVVLNGNTLTFAAGSPGALAITLD